MEIQQNDQELPMTVCGGILKDPSKYPSAEYQGKTVYFCTLACLQAFGKEPDLFMAGDVDHPIEDD